MLLERARRDISSTPVPRGSTPYQGAKKEREMVGETCPKCKEGVIGEIWTGGIS